MKEQEWCANFNIINDRARVMCKFQHNQWQSKSYVQISTKSLTEQELCAIFNKIIDRARVMCKFQHNQWQSKSYVQFSTKLLTEQELCANFNIINGRARDMCTFQYNQWQSTSNVLLSASSESESESLSSARVITYEILVWPLLVPQPSRRAHTLGAICLVASVNRPIWWSIQQYFWPALSNYRSR